LRFERGITMHINKITLPALTMIMSLTCWSAFVNAQTDGHAHGGAHEHEASHEHGAQGGAELALNNGKQWETDEALRLGMTEIRVAVDMLTPAFHEGKLDQSLALQLHEVVSGSVNTMIEQCKLEPEADANLHVILAQLLSASSQLEASPMSAEGMPKLKAALENYGHYFNHVGWHGDEQEHAGHAH
jgi:hypothetical protein